MTGPVLPFHGGELAAKDPSNTAPLKQRCIASVTRLAP